MSYSGNLKLDIDPKLLKTLPDISKSLEEICTLLPKISSSAAPAKTGFKAFTEVLNTSVKSFNNVAGTYKSYIELTKNPTPLKTFKELINSMSDLGEQTKETVFSLANQTTETLAHSTALGVETVASTSATFAQKALNMAMMAFPVMAIIAGIIELASCIASWIGEMNQGSDAAGNHKEKLEELEDQYQDIIEENQRSRDSFKETTESIKKQKESCEKLISKILELAEVDNKTATQKRKLALYISQLNGEMDGLNLQYDRERDVLSLNEDQIKAYAKAQNDLKNYTALLEQQNDLEKQLAETDDILAKSKGQLTEVTEASASGNKSEEETLNTLNQKIIDHQLLRDDLDKQLTQNTKELSSIDTEAAEQMVQNAEIIQEAYASRNATVKEFAEVATNMFEAVDYSSDINAEKMLENMQKNAETLQTYDVSLRGLRERFDRMGLDDAIIEQLANMGPADLPYMQALVSAGDDTLKELVDIYPENIELAQKSGNLSWQEGNPEMYAAARSAAGEMERGITEGGEEVAAAAENVVKNTQSAAFGAIQQLDFNSLGRDFCQGFAAAIKNNGSIITTAVQNVTKSPVAPANPAKKGSLKSSISPFALDPPAPLSLLSAVEEEGPALMNMVAEARNALDYNQAHVGLSQSAFGWATSAFTASLRPSVQETNNNFYQTIHTHDSLSPAEMTREAQTFLRRAKWKLPCLLPYPQTIRPGPSAFTPRASSPTFGWTATPPAPLRCEGRNLCFFSCREATEKRGICFSRKEGGIMI